jgi:hypothetical protein
MNTKSPVATATVILERIWTGKPQSLQFLRTPCSGLICPGGHDLAILGLQQVMGCSRLFDYFEGGLQVHLEQCQILIDL